MHNRCPGHMVLCKVTRVISATSSSNGYYTIYKVPILFQTNKRNCSRTEQISRHSPTTFASDADFVQFAQEEESSLDQTTREIDREPSRFRTFRPGLERVQRNLRDSPQPRATRQDLEPARESREHSKFRAIRVVYPRI